MAQNPLRVIAKFVRVAPKQDHAIVHFTWSDPETAATRHDSARLPGAMQPFWLDCTRTTMLALAGHSTKVFPSSS